MKLIKKGNNREVSTTTANAGARNVTCSGGFECGTFSSTKK